MGLVVDAVIAMKKKAAQAAQKKKQQPQQQQKAKVGRVSIGVLQLMCV
jgi:hypothetical protein